MKPIVASLVCILALMLAAASSAAQTVHVSLQEKGGGGIIDGKLLSFSESAYSLATDAGRVSVIADNVDCVSRACPIRNTPKLPTFNPSMKRIELSALDGSIKIEGDVLGFVDERYIVDVPDLGLISLKRAGLRCSGPGCRIREILALSAPKLIAPEVEADPIVPPRVIPFVGEKELTETLLPALLTGFANETNKASTIERLSRSSYSIAFGPDGDGVFVGGTGVDATFGAFTSGAADFAVTSRQLSDADVSSMKELGVSDLRNTEFETVLSVDSLSVAVNASLNLNTLQTEQLAAIYRGEITSWIELGGPNVPIVLVHREVGSTARSVFNSAIFDGKDIATTSGTIIVNSTQEMANTLANSPYAIGYLRDMVSSALQKVTLTGSCGNTTMPTAFSRMAEDTLMQQRMYLYNHPELVTKTGRSFSRFVRSASASKVLAQTSFAGFEVLRVPMSNDRVQGDLEALKNRAQLALARKLTAELPRWDRLSTTIRFPLGATILGQKEKDDIARLITYLDAIPHGAEISIVGFADASGDFGINLRLAQKRAELVERAMASFADGRLATKKITSQAYGELAPIQCNTSATGRAVNRRVEIWVRNDAP